MKTMENPANIIFFTFMPKTLRLRSMNDYSRALFGLKINEYPLLNEVFVLDNKNIKNICDSNQNNLFMELKLARGTASGIKYTFTMSRPNEKGFYYATGFLAAGEKSEESFGFLNNLNENGLFTNLFLNSHIGIAIIAPDRSVFRANPFIKNLFKIDENYPDQASFGDIFLCRNPIEKGRKCGTTEACQYCSINKGVESVLETGIVLEETEVSYEFILNNRLDKRWFTITISPIYHNGLCYAFVSFMDITAKKQIEQRLIRFGITDELTGLYNRRFILKEMQKLSNSEDGSEKPASVVMIDIDDFKKVNDTYGHLAGDLVLKGLADIILASTRHYDFAGRYGGEEFLIILPGATLKNATMVVKRILDRFSSTQFDGIDFNITFSAGIVEAIPGNHLQKDLFHIADEKMYEAKKSGKNCIKGTTLKD